VPEKKVSGRSTLSFLQKKGIQYILSTWIEKYGSINRNNFNKKYYIKKKGILFHFLKEKIINIVNMLLKLT
jgi:hypothetical protein